MNNGTALVEQDKPLARLRPIQWPVCRCEDFAKAAVSLGYDVGFAPRPEILGEGFRHVGTCVCGLAIGLTPEPVGA